MNLMLIDQFFIGYDIYIYFIIYINNFDYKYIRETFLVLRGLT